MDYPEEDDRPVNEALVGGKQGVEIMETAPEATDVAESTTLNIKPKTLKVPYKLSEVSKKFSIPKEALIAQLSMLVKYESLYAHDILELKDSDDFNLSRFAMTVLVFSFQGPSEAGQNISEFYKDKEPMSASIHDPATLFLTAKYHEARLEKEELAKQAIKADRRNRFMDMLMNEMPAIGENLVN